MFCISRGKEEWKRGGKECVVKRKKEYRSGNIEGRKLVVAFSPFTASELEQVSCSNAYYTVKKQKQ